MHLTYGELDARARSIGALLQEHGARGERALLLYPPGLEYIAAFFGCLYAGAVAVPAYPPRLNRSLPRLRSILEDALPQVALTTAAILGRVEGWRGQEPWLGAIPWLETGSLALNGVADWEDPGAGEDTLAFLQYTSGSTGTPKGVMLTHGNLLHNSRELRRCFGYSTESRGVVWLPPYHDMGLIGGILQPLYGGFSGHPDVAGGLPAEPPALAGGDLARSAPRSAAAPTSPTTCACAASRRRSARRSTCRAGRWPSAAPSRCAPRPSSASPRPSRPAASGARLSIPATAWPRRR